MFKFIKKAFNWVEAEKQIKKKFEETAGMRHL